MLIPASDTCWKPDVTFNDHVTAVDPTDAAALTVAYVWDGMQIGLDDHVLPVGYEYELQARYIDLTLSGHRYIFRPTTPVISGTMPEEGAAVTVICEIALEYFEGVLKITSVDGLTEKHGADGSVTVELL